MSWEKILVWTVLAVVFVKFFDSYLFAVRGNVRTAAKHIVTWVVIFVFVTFMMQTFLR